MSATGAPEPVPAVEEEDWLGSAQACRIRPDGTIDDECEACQ